MTLSFLILDTGALLAACCLTVAVKVLGPETDASFSPGQGAGPFGVALIGCLVAFYYSNLYDLRVTRTFADFAAKLPKALLLVAIGLGPAYVVWPGSRTEIEVAVLVVFTSVLLLIPARAALYHAAQRHPLTRRVLILGSGSLARDIAREIQASPAQGYSLLGLVEDRSAGLDGSEFSVAGKIDGVDGVIERLTPDVVVVALGERRGRLPMARLLASWVDGMKVEDGIEFYEHLTQKLAIESLSPSCVLFSGTFRKPMHALVTRRLASLAVSVVGLVLTAPVILIAAILIKLESPGPVFFVQQRAGKGGRPFRLIKLRTMHNGHSQAPESVWSREVEDRTTRIGHWLRRLRIDELPQFVNILRGDMDLVGPRPEMACNVKEMADAIPYYALRHVVRPGVTGWAQVRNGYAVSLEEVTEKTRYDLYYIKHMSPSFDLRILADTAKILLFGRGAR
jgi:exopolysaccharide biosynthesis polyprenyl glycosylphosphotransferase